MGKYVLIECRKVSFPAPERNPDLGLDQQPDLDLIREGNLFCAGGQ